MTNIRDVTDLNSKRILQYYTNVFENFNETDTF